MPRVVQIAIRDGLMPGFAYGNPFVSQADYTMLFFCPIPASWVVLDRFLTLLNAADMAARSWLTVSPGYKNWKAFYVSEDGQFQPVGCEQFEPEAT